MNDTYKEKSLSWRFWGNRTITFLFYDHWFRAATIAFVLLLVFLALFLPKIWTVSPEGFTPEVRISGLDKLQARSLRRSAERLATEGRLSDSMHAWRSAIINNPCDANLHRGLLRTLISQPLVERDYLYAGVQETFWLLRLTQTNKADVELAAQFYDKYGLPELTISQFDPMVGSLGPQEMSLLLKALFNSGSMARFDELWERHADKLKNDSEMGIYRAAFQAGWGPPGTIQQGRDKLEAAKSAPSTRLLAHRLYLAVCLRLGDVDGYLASLNELHQSHDDTVQENVQLWRLLVLSGQRAEALKRARAFSNPPESPDDAQVMLRVFNDLGMEDYAAEFLEGTLTKFRWSEEIPLRLAEQYTRLKKWDELRGLAVRIRDAERIRERLAGYSYFLEGFAEFHLNHLGPASEAFAKIPSHGIDNKILAFNTATALSRLGFPKPASELLKKFESSFTNRAEFYYQLTTAAYDSRQPDLLIPAAQKAYELDPENLDYMNNYAATLLATRTRPEEAIRLTLRLLEARPDSMGAHLNHAHALIQNLRFDDAEVELRAIEVLPLTPQQEASAKLARYEIWLSRGDRDRARRLRTEIDLSKLLQPQIKWLQDTASKSP